MSSWPSTGAGPPLVLLHGLIGSPAYWLPFARRLAAATRWCWSRLARARSESDRAASRSTWRAAPTCLPRPCAAAGRRPARSCSATRSAAPLAVALGGAAPGRRADRRLAGRRCAAGRAGSAMPALPRRPPIARAGAAVARWVASRTALGGRWCSSRSWAWRGRTTSTPTMARQMLRGRRERRAGAAADDRRAAPPRRARPAVDRPAGRCPSLVCWGEHDRRGTSNGPRLAGRWVRGPS